MEELVTEEQILALTNNQKREDFLKTWPVWPVLVEVPEIGLVVRQIMLPGKSRRILSVEYGTRGQTIHNESYRHCYFQVLYVKQGISPFNDIGTANAVDTLKKLRMEIAEQRKEAKS